MAALTGWIHGAVGTPYAAVQTAAYAVPLIMIALGVSPALRAGVIAVGADGQMVCGAILATTVGLSPLGDTTALIALPAGAVAGIIGGAAWSMLPALAQWRWSVSEILTALMANLVAAQLLAYLLRRPLADPAGFSTPRSAPLPDAALLPLLPIPGRLTSGVILLLLLLIAGAWWHRSRGALLMDVYAHNPWQAARSGITPARAILGTTAVSGAAAGLAGWLQVAGADGRLSTGVAGSIGFTGLVVAVIGRGRPVPIVLAGLLMAALTTGATGIELWSPTTPSSISTITQGVLLLAVAAGLAWDRKRRAHTRTRRP